MTDQTVSEVLHETANILQIRGWTHANGDEEVTKSAWWPEPGATDPVCLEGGMRLAAESHAVYRLAKDAVSEFLTDTYPDCINGQLGRVLPFSWNDRPGRTSDEVIAVVLATELIEAAKEVDVTVVTPRVAVTA